MSILSASPSASGSFSRAAISHSSTSSTRISAVSRPFRFGWSARECSCGATRFNVRTMAELVEDKQSTRRMSAPERTAVLASDLAVDDNVEHSTTFLDARSEEDLLTGIRKEILAGRLPSNIAVRMEEICHNYRDAVVQSGNPNARETILSNLAFAFDRILLDVEDPFTFSSHHKAIRKPFDYYTFGQNYIRPLIDFRRSYIGNISLFHAMEAQLQKGHNVILISNHQTEADPVIIALLLERTNPNICQKMTYVAGDRVVTDPVCKPFSMGRNLVCVYSKKHMHDIPELAEMKWRANTHSLKEMALLLRTGAQIIWIGPSGGRDRPDPSTGDWYPAPFGVSSVDNIRRLSDHSRVQGHMYPLALLCYNIMPPPPEVEKEIGERRMISYHGVGLSVSQEINFSEIASGIDSPEEAKLIFSQALYDSVCEQYNVLESAVHGNQGLNASNAIVSLSQPWK